jgi:Tol biopolymer transport system component
MNRCIPALALAWTGCVAAAPRDPLPGEIHLANLRQLTFEGENAEAYFSADGRRLIFQSTHGKLKCDQIFTMNADGSDSRMVSSGLGRTTCGYFFPDGRRILFSSTHLAGPDCPPVPDRSAGYVWPVYRSYDLFSARPDGSDLVRLTAADGYDAEATIAPDGSRIVFTSARDGDLEIYDMRPDGTDVRRLTHSEGYDGGAFYSPDGKLICFRAHPIVEAREREEYRRLLADEKVKPGALEIFVMNADGTGRRQVTSNGAANFCPFFHPDGKRLIFASNQHDPRRRDFDLYLINLDGSGLERVTFFEQFDGFPMFSPDGKKLVFCSNRHNRRPNETNVFIADWVE